MNAGLQSTVAAGFSQAFALIAQTVWFAVAAAPAQPRAVQAIVDGLQFATEARQSGGGMEEEFSGSIVFQKSDFTTTPPKVGDLIYLTQGGRSLRIKEVDGVLDQFDPFLTCHYWPRSR